MIEKSAPFVFYKPRREHPLIWEHNDFYINYLLRYKGFNFLEIDDMKAIISNNDIWIANPNKNNAICAVQYFIENRKNEINFRSLDINQANELRNTGMQQGIPSKIIPQTTNEIVYSSLELKSLSVYNLRHAHKHLIQNDSFTLLEVNSHNIDEAEEVLKKWRETQGIKYSEDLRIQKDSFYLKSSLEISNNAKSFLGYLDDKPVSIMTVGICGATASVILNKTLSGYKNQANEILGRRGVTEASYLLLCDHLEKDEITWINDGDSIPGSGAERRKLSWKPAHKINSFTLKMDTR